jgi:putative phage-type endonuclease
MKILNLEQGTSEWHSWRRQHVCASDSPIILGKSPYKSPLQLFEDIVFGKKSNEINDSMKKGHELEPRIRDHFERVMKIPMVPTCIESDEFPWMGASLDGLSFCEEIFLEIKLNNAENHRLAYSKRLCEHHMIQVQKQWLVGKGSLKKGYYISYNIAASNYHILETFPDPQMHETIIKEEIEFRKLVQRFASPPFEERDYLRKAYEHEWEALCT